MKAELYVVFSVIVTTLALQSPNEHAVQQRILDQIEKVGTVLAEVMPEDRRFDSRHVPLFLTNMRRSPQKKRIKPHHIIGGADTAANLGHLGLGIYDAINGESGDSSRRASPGHVPLFVSNMRRSPEKKRAKAHHIIGGADAAANLGDLGLGIYNAINGKSDADSSRRAFRRNMPHYLINLRRSSKKPKETKKKKRRIKADHFIDGTNALAHAADTSLSYYKAFNGDNAASSRRKFPTRQFHTGVNYRKKNRQLDVDHLLSAAELALRAAELYGNRRYGHGIALNRRQGAAGKKEKPAAKGGEKSGGGKTDKGGGKAPEKAPPAEKPGDKEMPSASGSPSWEDIFKQIVIKVISRRSGHTRRTFGAVPYDVLDLQQRSLHDLLHMLYNLPYYGEPVYGYRSNWNPESGMNNGRLRIHSVKYSNPPQTADMDIRF